MNDQMRNTQMILETLDEIKLSTTSMRTCDFSRTSNVIVELDPFDWTFTWVSVFLNELDSWRIDDNNGLRKQKKANGKKYFFFFFWLILNTANNADHIIINFEEKIIVKISKNIVEKWNNENFIVFYIKKFFI